MSSINKVVHKGDSVHGDEPINESVHDEGDLAHEDESINAAYEGGFIHERVAIVGRPNVGKSTLFNRLTKTRKSMVRNQAGVTRDILIETASWWGRQFDVADTGGLTEGKEGFAPEIRNHILSLLHTFDLLIVVVDGRAGLVPEDADVVRMAQKSGCPFVIAVNKVDQMHQADLILSDFFELGGELIATSFEKQDNVDSLVEWILKNLSPPVSSERESCVKLSVVGKPNVGKSSLCNQLLGQKRMLVSQRAGTTVDAIEASFSMGTKNYLLVDTAGMRRSSKRHGAVERISAIFSKKAIHGSDIVFLLVDAVEGPTVQDAKIVEYIIEEHKPVILVANKVDAAKSHRSAHRQWFHRQVEKQFHFFPDIPIVFICALSGFGLKQLFEKVEDIWSKMNTHISTSQLNKFFYEVIRQAPAPVEGSKNVKFYYLTQTKQKPPSFIAFANRPDGVSPSYRRFLSKRIKANWNLKGIPVRLFVMKSGRSS